ncbi:DHA2 family efflux MFS transporter permease subunit [Actinoplanes sp. NPDC051470]|uniref:DHA2 family efflux MFS transporter permease subunit n=1 Tax=Actinoplanes sp. NPDC051470 TaxID=3157224 RepID=UPI003444E806
MRKWSPLVAVSLGTFMLLVDVTIVNVALPSMALALDTSFTALQWVIDGYSLALAALLLVAGACADRYGRRAAYVGGVALFALASLACGLAPSPEALVAARLVQGIGAAAMFAATTALLQSSYTGRDRGTAFGVWGAVSGASAAAGPILGGLLTEGVNWRAIFLVNIPVAVVTVVLTWKVVPETRNPAGRVDWAGGAAFTVAAAALTYALIAGGEHGWSGPRTVSGLAIAAVALLGFVAVERKQAHPLLDLRLFRSASFTALMIAAVVLQGAAFGPLAYVSVWLQSLLGLGPVDAGLVVLPLCVASFVVSAAVGRLLHGISPRMPVGVGLLFIGAGALLMTLVGPGSGWGALVPGLAVAGVGVGLAMPVLVSATLAAVPHERAGMAGAAVNTFRQLGMALGIAVLGTLFSGRLEDSLHATVTDAHATAAGLSRGAAQSILAHAPQLNEAAHRAFADGLDLIFLGSGVAALLGGVLVLAVVRPAARNPQTTVPVDNFSIDQTREVHSSPTH